MTTKHRLENQEAYESLERRYPSKPMKPGFIECIEFEYVRHGTRCLIANSDVATGRIIAPSVGKTRTEEDFAKHVAATIDTDPDAEWIFVIDQLNTHMSPSPCRLIARRRGMDIDLGNVRRNGPLKDMKTALPALARAQGGRHRAGVFESNRNVWVILDGCGGHPTKPPGRPDPERQPDADAARDDPQKAIADLDFADEEKEPDCGHAFSHSSGTAVHHGLDPSSPFARQRKKGLLPSGSMDRRFESALRNPKGRAAKYSGLKENQSRGSEESDRKHQKRPGHTEPTLYPWREAQLKYQRRPAQDE